VSEFRTRNLCLSAFLAHIGIAHIRTEKVGPTSTILIFDDPLDECQKIERDFYSGAGCEDAQRLLETYRDVKSTVNTARQEGVWKAKEN